MEILIISGLSGAGKSRAASFLEDIGFYIVDNIPAAMILKFAEFCAGGSRRYDRVALVYDVRTANSPTELFAVLDSLKHSSSVCSLLFLEASPETIIKRYKETRRRHPLMKQTASLEAAVLAECELMKPLRQRADYIIDTSYLAPSQLKQSLSNLFLGNVSDALTIQIMSFGFKNGIPTEADMMFDVRCLPNPFYVPELKKLTGLDEPVKEYVMKWDETQGFITRFLDLIDYMIPLFCNEGKSQLVIAIGCTGGQHRSVTIVELLYKHLIAQNKRASVNHRDIKR